MPWAAKAELVEADLTKPRDLEKALEGIDVAYYLVHSLGAPDFELCDERWSPATGEGEIDIWVPIARD